MPETFDLSETAQCTNFMQKLTKENSSELNWIIKVSRYSHNGEGITLLDSKAAKKFSLKTCPFKNKIIAQRYINNPLLINKRKFDFRAYLAVISMDPLMLLYHDGYIKFSIDEYSYKSLNHTVHLTNTNMAKQTEKLENLDSIMEQQSWSFEKFEKYMNQNFATDLI